MSTIVYHMIAKTEHVARIALVTLIMSVLRLVGPVVLCSFVLP